MEKDIYFCKNLQNPKKMLLYDVLLIIVWLSSLLVIFRLIYKSGNLHLNSNRILLVILGIYTFGITRHISMDFVEKLYAVKFPIGLIFNTSLVCFIPILFYLYVKKTVSNDNAFNSTDIIHIVVFFIFYIFFELPFKPTASEFMSLSQEDIYWSNYFNAKKIPTWLLILRNLLNLAYCILTYNLLLSTFKNKPSTKEDSTLKRFLNKFTHIKSPSKQIEKVKLWLYNLTHYKALMSLFTLYFSIKLSLNDEVFYNDQHYASSFLAFMILGLLYYLNKNETILYNLPSFMNKDSLRREKIKEEIKVEEIYKYVVSQIEEHKLYLDDQLRLDWLANELEIKEEYISVTLKENKFDNFKMFVNYLKVKKAKELIKGGYLRKYNIEALAKACGFKATNSFYRIFKNETGLTPKMFSENLS